MGRRRPLSTSIAALVVGSLLLGLASPARAEPPGVRYEPPVDAPVVDAFRPPSHAYGPGNRGLEYGTSAGDPVRAAADGEVVWSGAVAGALHVTVRHADGLRTSYSFLGAVDVAVGATVRRGEVVGTAAGSFHFGVRAGDQYLDPAALFADDDLRLVPASEASTSAADERAPLVRLVRAAAALGSRAGERGVAAVEAARRAGRAAWTDLGQRLPVLLHYAGELRPARRAARVADRLAAWVRARDDCTAETVTPPPPAERRIAVLVGGLGSNSDSASIDDLGTEVLGYDAGDVVRFSYRGGRVPGDVADDLAGLPESRYESADTQVDLARSGDELLDLLAAVQASAPGVPIDVFAHSQGGVVTRVALDQGERTDRLPAEVDTVVTYGSPHQGSDLATALVAIERGIFGRRLLDAVESRLRTGLDPSAPGVQQLAETSELTGRLATVPPPPSVRFRTLGARGDVVVTAGRTAVPGLEPVVLDGAGISAHGALPGSDAATRETALALAGLPPTCSDLGDALADAVVAEALSWGQDGAGFLVWSVSG